MMDTAHRPAETLRRGGGVPVEACGAAIVLLGGLAFLAPLLAPAFAAIALAGALLAAGAIGAVALTSTRREHFIWRALWVAVASLVGAVVLYHHWTGRLSLPWALGLGSAALALVAAGDVFNAGRHRRLAWGWVAVATIFTLFLGALLLGAGPHVGTMVLALFVAANLAGFGLTLVVTGLIVRASASLL